MLKRLCTLVALTSMATIAAAQPPPPPPPDNAPAPARLQEAMVLDLAGQLGLDDAQTLKLYQGYRAAQAKTRALRGAEAAARKALREALDAGATDAALAPLLDTLRKAEMDVAQAQQAGALEMSAGLSPAQQAKVYLLVTDMPRHAGRPGPHPPKGPGAPDAAPAAAPTPPPAPAPTLEEQALALVKEWVVNAKKKDLDAMLAPVSDKFNNPTYGDKAGLRAFIEQGIAMGYFDDIEVSLEDTEIEVDKDGKASVYPVDVSGTFGSVTVEFIAKQEDGVWKVVGLDISGI